MEAFTKREGPLIQGEVWISIPLQDEPQPGQIAGTRMSYRRDWIEQQIKSHADPLDAILLESAEQAEVLMSQ